MKPIKIELLMESNLDRFTEQANVSLGEIRKRVQDLKKEIGKVGENQNIDELIKGCENAIEKLKQMSNTERTVLRYTL